MFIKYFTSVMLLKYLHQLMNKT